MSLNAKHCHRVVHMYLFISIHRYALDDCVITTAENCKERPPEYLPIRYRRLYASVAYTQKTLMPLNKSYLQLFIICILCFLSKSNTAVRFYKNIFTCISLHSNVTISFWLLIKVKNCTIHHRFVRNS